MRKHHTHILPKNKTKDFLILDTVIANIPVYNCGELKTCESINIYSVHTHTLSYS